MNIFVFDIETIPDTNLGRKIYGLTNLSDHDVAEAMFAKQHEKNGTTFLPLYMHKIIAISVVFRSNDLLKVWSLGDVDAEEKELIQRFFDGIEKYSPTLISWNGSGFDLPVIHYRGLANNNIASQYWELGDNDKEFRYNNYINRYHYRHMDLMDILANYQARANAPLDHLATLLGFPGKMGMSGANVWDAYQQREIVAIRNYCETDVINTYLVYLQFEFMRGNLTTDQLSRAQDQLKHYLQQQNQPHFNEFLTNWDSKGIKPT